MGYQKEDASCWYRQYKLIIISLPSNIQFHTCIASRYLSFQCGDNSEPSSASSVTHAVQPLLALFGLECYMPTILCMVHPRTTSYWERYGSDTICTASYYFQDYRLTPQTNTSIFSMLCPHLHAFRETSHKATYPYTTPSQARLTMEFLWNELPKIRCTLLVQVVPINPHKPSMNHAVSY